MSRSGNSHSRSKPTFPTDENLKPNSLHSSNEATELRQENVQLKRQLKEAQMKRNLAIKQLSDALHRNESLEKKLGGLQRRSKDKAERSSAEEYKVQQLHFLNRELNNEIESLRGQNEKLMAQLRHSTSLLENKYQELERSTLSKVELAAKRIKKTVSYLSSLSGKELEKTRKYLFAECSSLVQNLQKSLELLRGRFVSEDVEEQVHEMMSPLNVLKEELTVKDRDVRQLRERLEHVEEQLEKEQNINRDIIPQYKSAIDKLKKSLQQCRACIAELEQEKQTIRQTSSARLKELERSNKQLSSNLTRVTLENKVYQGKLEQLQGEVEEEKDRLQDQNQLLKKLYSQRQSAPSSPSKTSESNLYQLPAGTSPLTSSRSSAQLNHSRSLRPREMLIDRPPTVSSKHSRFAKKLQPHQQTSYSLDRERESFTNRDRSSYEEPELSQANLKHEIDQVDQEIAEIQKNLARQLEAYNL